MIGTWFIGFQFFGFSLFQFFRFLVFQFFSFSIFSFRVFGFSVFGFSHATLPNDQTICYINNRSLKEIVRATKPSMTGIFDDHNLMQRILGCVTGTKTLVLNKMARVCASWHTHVAREFLRITTLDVSFCTNAGLARLAAGCPAITNLSLAGCIQITNAGLAHLATGWPAITTLDLTGCIQITKTGLQSLAAGCPAIITLNLTGCDAVNAWEPEDVFGDRLGLGLTWVRSGETKFF